MVASEEWAALLPPNVQPFIGRALAAPLRDDARKSAATVCSLEGVRESALSDDCVASLQAAASTAAARAARQLFSAADGDNNGSIDPQECAWLVQVDH